MIVRMKLLTFGRKKGKKEKKHVKINFKHPWLNNNLNKMFRKQKRLKFTLLVHCVQSLRHNNIYILHL